MSSTIETTDSTMSSSTTSTTSITTISSSISGSSIATTATITTSSTVTIKPTPYVHSLNGVAIVASVGVIVFLCVIVLLIKTLCKRCRKEKVTGQSQGIPDRRDTLPDVPNPYRHDETTPKEDFGAENYNLRSSTRDVIRIPVMSEIRPDATRVKQPFGGATNLGFSTRDVLRDRSNPFVVNPDRLNHVDETDMNTEKQTTQL